MPTHPNPRIRPGDRIARKAEVLSITGLSNTSLWRLIRQGDLPAPIHLGKQARGWIVRELYEALNAKAEHSGGRGV